MATMNRAEWLTAVVYAIIVLGGVLIYIITHDGICVPLTCAACALFDDACWLADG
jgi:hypothetical protein